MLSILKYREVSKNLEKVRKTERILVVLRFAKEKNNEQKKPETFVSGLNRYKG
ncbi:hypothetical protein HMPREF0766_12948 [Sphingobacterium spiritivorum ATCC 33861]|uniref:Uncharacterized protein n=1 Tax=Sphingobacterium spiritivorum ATCC 33861 TaxID=525373 RepID=D7VPM8_SPHSI|nr:hypothetical protein HMPREF0766_12948 [Sphingobacterium spiritivorum ATCC 33861]